MEKTKIKGEEYWIKENEDGTLTLTKTDKVKLRPDFDETYYSIDTVGGVGFSYFNAKVDKKRWSIGNGFFTQEEAEKEIERRKVFQLLKDFKLKHDNVELDWENTLQIKWSVKISYISNNVFCDCQSLVKDLNNVYFSSKEITNDAIKEIGGRRIYNAFK